MLKRIGLFGGTFDPVHNGHTSLARSFLASKKIDELWILLTPFPPHKQGNEHTLYQQRLDMLDLAFGSYEQVSILTIENELPKPSFTYRTIEFLKREKPEYEYLYCLGEDSLASFNSWKYPERILDQVSLLVAQRPGTDHSHVENTILNKAFFVQHEPLAISSSVVKERLMADESISGLVDPKVETYIRSNRLYDLN